MLYKIKTDKELFELLQIHQKLTFNAQLSLLDELKERGLESNALELQNTVAITKSKISNLNYLKDLGYSASEEQGDLVVVRTVEATLVDLLASFLGLLFCFYGLQGLFGLAAFIVSENEFSLIALLIQLGKIGIGILGIGFLNGIGRLIDNLDFELKKFENIVLLRKWVDLKKTKIEGNPSSLNMQEGADQLHLFLNKYKILSANSKSRTQRMTINALNTKLKK